MTACTEQESVEPTFLPVCWQRDERDVTETMKHQHEAHSIHQLSSAADESLSQSEIEADVIRDFFDSISKAARLFDTIPKTMTHSFPATMPEENEAQREYYVNHWYEIGGRIRVAMSSADRNLRDLVDGFMLGLEHRIASVMALTARSALECSASYYNLCYKIQGKRELIEQNVLGFLDDDNSVGDSGLYKSDLVDDLTRFQHGSRQLVTGRIETDDVAGWKRFRNSTQYTSKPKSEQEDQSKAGEILDFFKINQINILSLLEKIQKRREHAHILVVYDYLSEFCHPNSSCRNVGVSQQSVDGDGIAHVQTIGDNVWMHGTEKATYLGMCAIATSIQIHIEGHNMIWDISKKLLERKMQRE